MLSDRASRDAGQQWQRILKLLVNQGHVPQLLRRQLTGDGCFGGINSIFVRRYRDSCAKRARLQENIEIDGRVDGNDHATLKFFKALVVHDENVVSGRQPVERIISFLVARCFEFLIAQRRSGENGHDSGKPLTSVAGHRYYCSSDATA